jgi:GR25 family glycosyltransferase involved in LPS biosynthesis
MNSNKNNAFIDINDSVKNILSLLNFSIKDENKIKFLSNIIEIVMDAKVNGYNTIFVINGNEEYKLMIEDVDKFNLIFRSFADSAINWDTLWFTNQNAIIDNKVFDYIYKIKNMYKLSAFALKYTSYDKIMNISDGKFFIDLQNYSIGDIIRISDQKNMMNVHLEKKYQDFMSKTKTYCINLLRRPDRKKEMIQKFKERNIQNVNFFEAIDGKTIEATDEIKKLFKKNTFGSRKYTIACAMSHYRIYQELVQSDEYEYMLIFEDDIIIRENYHKKVSIMLSLAQKVKWDAIYMGITPVPIFKDFLDCDSKQPILKRIEPQFLWGGHFAYIISKNGAKKLLKVIDKWGIYTAMDTLLMLTYQFDVYHFCPEIVVTPVVTPQDKTVDSDIQRNFQALDLS